MMNDGKSLIFTMAFEQLGAFMNGALSKKGEANTFPDTGKRRLQVNTKDHFWHVTHTPRHKQVLEAWMRDLAGAKPLSAIAKKVPIFNKREEIFLTLAENQVPMIRAAWFLKMTASYNSAISEAKTKKRQMPDPSQGQFWFGRWRRGFACLELVLVKLWFVCNFLFQCRVDNISGSVLQRHSFSIVRLV
jgi:hypothetical protein